MGLGCRQEMTFRTNVRVNRNSGAAEGKGLSLSSQSRRRGWRALRVAMAGGLT